MSHPRLILLLACLAGPAGAAPAPFPRENPPDARSWSNPVDGLRFRLVATRTRWRVGEPISLVLEVQNAGAAPAVIQEPELLPMISPPGEQPWRKGGPTLPAVL
jgi:hypothetical protein